MTQSTKQSSRFSTLKVFKFASSGSSSASKPPPPPPKDPYYLNNNRSLASLSHSLSPDSFSLPPTPQYTSYGLPRSDSPGSSGTATASTSSASPSTENTGFKKGFSMKLGSFGRKPYALKANKSMMSLRLDEMEQQQQQPQTDSSDDGISMPWNFQHHVHVDETMKGLPPSWSSSLQAAGFTEEEIASIRARRAVSPSSPSLHSLSLSRPQTPASQAAGVLTHPHPRTSSLPRQYSTASMSQRSYSPSNASVRRPPQSRKFSNASRQTDVSDSPSDAQYVTMPRRPSVSSSARDDEDEDGGDNNRATIIGMPPAQRTDSPSVQSSFSYSTPSEKGHPMTPPQRTYRITNAEPGSPPPAYASPPHPSPLGHHSQTDTDADVEVATLPAALPSPNAPSFVSDDDDRRQTLRPSRKENEGEYVGGETSNGFLSASPLGSPVKRSSIVPPRLSLSEDSLGDLSSWTESLFSALPSASSQAEGSSPSSSFMASKSSSAFASSSFLQPSSLSPHSPLSPRSTHERKGSRKSMHLPPSIVVKPTSEIDHTSSIATTPLFDEIMGMVNSPLSSTKSPRSPTSPCLTVPPRSPHPVPDSAILPKSEYVDVDEEAASDEQHIEDLSLSADVRGRENRDSSMSDASNRSTVTVTNATIIRGALATRAVAEVLRQPQSRSSSRAREPEAQTLTIDVSSGVTSASGDALSPFSALPSPSWSPRSPVGSVTNRESVQTMRYEAAQPGSPQSTRSSTPSNSNSSGSGTSSSMTEDTFETELSPRPLRLDGTVEVEKPLKSPGLAYMDPSPGCSPQPSPARSAFDNVKGAISRDDSGDIVRRPSIVINGIGMGPSEGDADEALNPPSSVSSSSSSRSPLTPAQRYPGWLYQVVRPLEEFIDDVEPTDLYDGLQEIAEGESGSVFSARVKASSPDVFVAIKQIPILPSGTPKLTDLQRELTLMKGVRHENVLPFEHLYVDLQEDSLWIRMELMDRSLADVIALNEDGITITEEVMARFASDVLSGLQYLQSLHIAHRDLRSDNMLLNAEGVLKIADFSTAVKVSLEEPMCCDVVGVAYWQAPEVRKGSYNALNVDVWSLGATVWEMAEGEPPFSDIQNPLDFPEQWPMLRRPDVYSESFHDFLDLCSRPNSIRPTAEELLQEHFIRRACPRSVVIQLLSDCRDLEEKLQRRQSVGSQGTIS